MKFQILGAAVALAFVVGPVMTAEGKSSSSQSVYCATREAGNPYSKQCDYVAWTNWRRGGGWDSRLDNACLRNPHYVPPRCIQRYAH
jgi:hypothetical protein